MNKLRKTNDKNNIMREASELFFDKDFIANMDTNKYLLCFNNGVVDFRTKTFRDGYPQDYITKTTNVNYSEFNTKDEEMYKISLDINTFMNKLFPIPAQNKYMWDHLASCLIGTNKNQTFNIYHGSGSNGKSMLADLMSHTLGQYKGVVPVNLITDKRVSIGGTSDEIMKLKGIRYAVAQELTKGMKLNEGIMKELTGGDPIQARGLYCESETFYPQFKLVMCTNNLFDIESNDDGTWRRIRRVVYHSKFVDETVLDQYTDLPYVFPKDKSLEEKLPTFAPVFASMLVKRAFETDGIVADCEVVLADSNNYRKGQDHIAAFVAEMICKTDNQKDKVKKAEIANQFKLWFQNEQGSRRTPKGEELYEFMDKKFGPHKSTGWHGIKIVYPDMSDDINENF
jgi:P4 family phage/plasmid primase-like protien